MRTLSSTKSIILKIMQLRILNAYFMMQSTSSNNVESKMDVYLSIVCKESLVQQQLWCRILSSNKESITRKLTASCNQNEKWSIQISHLLLNWCGFISDYTCLLIQFQSIHECMLYAHMKLKIQQELLQNWWWNISSSKRCQNRWIQEEFTLFKLRISFE